MLCAISTSPIILLFMQEFLLASVTYPSQQGSLDFHFFGSDMPHSLLKELLEIYILNLSFSGTM